MAATLHTPPPTVALLGDAINAKLTTNNVVPSYTAAIVQMTNAASITDGDTLTLKWENNVEVLVFKTSPDAASALEFPLPGSSFSSGYRTDFINKLKSNDRLATYFNITGGGGTSNFIINFDAWNPEKIALTITQVGISGITINVMNAVDTFKKTNLSALVVVREWYDNAELIRLTQPYTVDIANANGYSNFDLRGAFNLAPTLPASLATIWQRASKTYINYKIAYADRYGAPPLAEALQTAGKYSAILGYPENAFAPNAGGGYLCHVNKTHYIAKDQPAWIYFFTPSVLTPATVQRWVTIIQKNGTETNYFLADLYTLQPDMLFWMRCDYANLLIETTAAGLGIPVANIQGYKIEVKTSNGATVLATRTFTLTDYVSPCFRLTFAYFNGMGGIDTIDMHPRYRKTVNVERNIIQIEGANQKGVQRSEAELTYEVKTDFYPRAYAEDLAQMLLGEVWLVDKDNDKFTPVICDTKDIELQPERVSGLVRLNLTFKSSKIYKAF